MKKNNRTKLFRRKTVGLLCGVPILLACANSSAAFEPAESGMGTDNGVPAQASPAPTPEVKEIDKLRAMAGANLSPDQGIDERHIGKPIRWAGAVQYVTRSDNGVCLTILYALSDDNGQPRWTSEPTNQTFEACTDGSYDRELVYNGANVTIVGKISGKTYIGMGGGGSTGPVVGIENLYRWSDCLSSETSPICKSGFLTPMPLTDD